MSKSYRNNQKARARRGKAAFMQKAKRQAATEKRRRCAICGQNTRITKLTEGTCPRCTKRLGIGQQEATDAIPI